MGEDDDDDAGVRTVRALLEASGDRDWDRYGRLLTEGAVFRRGGVPSALGGVITGRGAICNSLRANLGDTKIEVRALFGGGDRVCAIQQVVSRSFPGNQFLRGAVKPYTTEDCTVFRLEDGLVAEITIYTNWLDVYVQTGLVDLDVLATRGGP